MPSLPPFSRSEKLETYARVCEPVVWREQRIRAADGVEIALAVGGVEGEDGEEKGLLTGKGHEKGKGEVVVVYFQGYVWF